MTDLMLRLHIWCTTVLTTGLLTGPAEWSDPTTGDGRPGRPRDRGQATTEYALVMLGAAAVALLVITWATAGGGAGRIGRLFDRVIDGVVSRI